MLNSVFHNNFPFVAKYFEECGADYIHLVDLDGALQGQTVNANAIKKQ